MPAEWYYTTNKVQMGPVSWNELRELANVGILKPHDLVWCEGMEEWIKAINQNGLIADGADEADEKISRTKKSSYAEPKPPPGRRRRREEDETDEEDDQEEKRKSRNKKQQNTHMAVGIKVGLILASVLVLLMLLGCGIGILVYISTGGGGGGGGGLVNQTYTVFNLQQNRMEERRFNFHQGRRVVITATNNLAFPNTDVDLRIFQGNNPNPIVWDDRLPIEDRNCRVEFVVPANDVYRVRIVNLGPGTANSSVVTIHER